MARRQRGVTAIGLTLELLVWIVVGTCAAVYLGYHFLIAWLAGDRGPSLGRHMARYNKPAFEAPPQHGGKHRRFETPRAAKHRGHRGDVARTTMRTF